MNYNILSYLVYACITIYIIYYVGRLFHRNGRIFILRLFKENESLTDTTNNILLMAYYLFNIGYSVIQFSFWEKVTGISTMISSISVKTGILILILAITHYFNILLIYFLSKRNNHLITFKNIPS
ncbi:MAG TPA: hypothetical protein VK498_05035 [Ferruginibacter sp.]|nr:hypothetical protein [Ferruginibacter sp.]